MNRDAKKNTKLKKSFMFHLPRSIQQSKLIFKIENQLRNYKIMLILVYRNGMAY